MEREIRDSAEVISRAIIESAHSFYSERKRNQRIPLKKDGFVYVLTRGSVSFYRARDDILSVTVHAPTILGLSQLRRRQITTYYMRCEEACSLWSISSEDALRLLDDQNLWSQAFDILSLYLYLYLEREEMMNQGSVRDTVIGHLRHIWKIEEPLRNKVSVYTFILARNHISRSSVHKVIQDLTATGHVSLRRGKLVSFNDPEERAADENSPGRINAQG